MGEGGNPLVSVGFLVMLFAIFYFMIIRPQSKRQKDRQKMLDAVKKGDKIVTAGGIYATVIGVEEKTVLVQIADNVKVKLDRSGISTLLTDSTEKPAA
ncbi:MAG: preprotein translocase subunit YajC [bacterium]